MERFRGNFSVASLVKLSFNTLTSEADAKAVEAFFKDKKERSTFVQGLAQGLDAVRSKAKWIERDTKDVEAWLKENGYLTK
jgi:aminopeptidase 2